MKKSHFSALSALAALLLVTSGCAEGVTPTGLSQASAPSAPSFRKDKAPADTVQTVSRTTPLEESISVSRVIGPKGGHIEIKEAGFKISFPKEAVSEPVEITATAHAGGDIVYTFAPHGLIFNAPVEIEQKLKDTTAEGSFVDLVGGYFATPDAFLEDGTVVVSEVITTFPEVDKKKLSFYIEHFSGYLLGTNRHGR